MVRESEGKVIEQHLDVLAIGEILVDMISDTEQGSLLEAHTFHMYPGGEAANVALNVARLGGSSALIGCVGDDAFGSLVRHHLTSAGVRTDYLCTKAHVPTTMVVVTRHRATPDFTVYRGADMCLTPDDMPEGILSMTSVVHTSAFAIAEEPCRSTVLQFIEQAHRAGCYISFDPNYHPKIWNSGADPLAIFAKLCPSVFICKPSLDDCVRLFGVGQSPENYAARFLELGVQNVVLTMGQAGVLLANSEGVSYHSAPLVKVADVTGAGDSFWSGMILAVLDGYTVAEAVHVGQAVAALKLQQVGPLSHVVDRASLYEQLGLTSHSRMAEKITEEKG